MRKHATRFEEAALQRKLELDRQRRLAVRRQRRDQDRPADVVTSAEIARAHEGAADEACR
jgi:hypothetical protein